MRKSKPFEKTIRMLPIFCLLLAILFIAGCTGKSGNDAEEPRKSIPFLELTDYKIIRGEEADEETISAASELFSTLKKEYSLELPFQTDYVKKGEEIPTRTKEIVVGVTNRNPDDGNERYSDYSISYENERIVICGGSGTATKAAVKQFLKLCVADEKVNLEALPYQYRAVYSMENLNLEGIALKDFSVAEIDGTADDELRQWLGTRAGIRKQSDSGYVIRLASDPSLYLNEINAAWQDKTLTLSTSACLDDLSIAVSFFKNRITTRSEDSITMNGKGTFELREPDEPLTDVRDATGNVKMVYAVTDKDPLSYTVGEDIVFNCTLYSDGKIVSCPKFTWEASTDDGKIYSGESEGFLGRLVVKIPATGAGFARLKVLVKDEKGTMISGVNQSVKYDSVTVFSAGVNTSSLTAKATEPTDFDSFWAGEVAKVTAIDPDLISMEKVENPGSVTNVGDGAVTAENFDFYRIKIQTPEECGYAVGYLSIPKNRPAGSLGITVVFNGYGVDDLGPHASSTDIVLNVCAHSIELGREASYYSNLSNSGGALYNYCFKNNDSRNTCYFRTMILRDLQAVRFIKAYAGTEGVRIGGSAKQSLGLWNGKLRLYGGSQGAFQGIAVAALDHDVTDAYWWIPWMCDVNGTRSEFRPSYTSALRYFDSVYFGKRISQSVNVTITMGLGDYICPPSGVIALYNGLNCHVTMTCKQGMTHGTTPSGAATTTYRK